MCEYLDVSTSGYYDWRDRPASERAQYDAVLVDQIVEMHRGHEENYGAVRVHPYLRGLSYSCSRRRINRLMKAHGIRSKYHAHRPRRSNGTNAPVADNLLATRPLAKQSGEHWAGDMTYLKTKEGDFYLAAILDLWSRKVIGWAFSRNHDADLVKGALDMSLAFETRQPDCLFHSDQGSEYRSENYRARLAEVGMISSMSRPGKPTDNAYVESFFKTLRNELLHHWRFNTLTECVARVLDYVEFYNERRLHSGLNYLSPNEYQLLHSKCP